MYKVWLQRLKNFSGRSSVGVRGVRLVKSDSVISLAILNGVDFDVEERIVFKD